MARLSNHDGILPSRGAVVVEWFPSMLVGLRFAPLVERSGFSSLRPLQE